MKPTHLVDIVLSVKGEGKREDIVLLVIWTPVVEDILVGDTLPSEQNRTIELTLTIAPMAFNHYSEL